VWVEAAAAEAGRALSRAPRNKSSSFSWSLWSSCTWVPGRFNTGHFWSPLLPLSMPRNQGPSCPTTNAHGPSTRFPLRAQGLGAVAGSGASSHQLPAQPSPPSQNTLGYDGQEGWHGDFVTCSPAQCPHWQCQVLGPLGREGCQMRPSCLSQVDLKESAQEIQEHF
jgi:hypothetical protein